MGKTADAIAEGVAIATAAARLTVRNHILVETIAHGAPFDPLGSHVLRAQREHPLHETAKALNTRHVRLSVEPAGKEFAVWVKTRWAAEILDLLAGQLDEDAIMEEVFRKKGEQPK